MATVRIALDVPVELAGLPDRLSPRTVAFLINITHPQISACFVKYIRLPESFLQNPVTNRPTDIPLRFLRVAGEPNNNNSCGFTFNRRFNLFCGTHQAPEVTDLMLAKSRYNRKNVWLLPK